MADVVRLSERIQHTVTRQTTKAFAWTGATQVLLSLLTLCWTVWEWVWGRREEEDRKEKADREDISRRLKAEEKDRARREKEEEEDRKRRRRADEEDARRRERADREEAEREEKKEASARQLEALVGRVRAELHDVKVDQREVKKYYQTELEMKDIIIKELEREKADLQRRVDSSPGWAPGGSGGT